MVKVLRGERAGRLTLQTTGSVAALQQTWNARSAEPPFGRMPSQTRLGREFCAEPTAEDADLC